METRTCVSFPRYIELEKKKRKKKKNFKAEQSDFMERNLSEELSVTPKRGRITSLGSGPGLSSYLLSITRRNEMLMAGYN